MTENMRNIGFRYLKRHLHKKAVIKPLKIIKSKKDIDKIIKL